MICFCCLNDLMKGCTFLQIKYYCKLFNLSQAVCQEVWILERCLMYQFSNQRSKSRKPLRKTINQGTRNFASS